MFEFITLNGLGKEVISSRNVKVFKISVFSSIKGDLHEFNLNLSVAISLEF